jgi:Histidine kinase-like ATPase domain
MDDLLEIEVAADAASLRMVRLVALDAAERAGLDCDASDDLRLGVEELCFAAVAAAPTDAGRLGLRFRVSAGAVIVHGVARLGSDRVEVGLSRVGMAILAVVVDQYELVDVDGVVRFALVKHKVALEAVAS